jgi:tRNA(Ile)-lysidine synthase
MSWEFENTLAQFIEVNHLFENAEGPCKAGTPNKVLLAVSGGADSTALLHALCSLKDKKIFNVDFFCAHINHSLRGPDSDRDQQSVVEQARRLELPIIAKKINVSEFARKNKLSIETAARNLRIKTLLEIAGENNCFIIATAHQADDNAETIIHNIIRGTGLRGLAGIWPKRNFDNDITFVRPLLCFTRQQITDYLEERKLAWRTDKTNLDCSYKRNFIRHLLLPKIQQQSSTSLVELLSLLAGKANHFCLSLQSLTEQIWPAAADFEKDGLKLKLKIFSVQHPEVKIELIRKGLNYLGCGQRDLTFDHYRKILVFADKRLGNKTIVLPGGFCVKKEYDNLLICRPVQKSGIERRPAGTIEIAVPRETAFSDYKVEAQIFEAEGLSIEKLRAKKDKYAEQFDLEKITPPVKFRRRLEGDRFCPLGLDSDKKISRFLIDEKLPFSQRQKTLVVTDSEKIIWLWPIRISDKVKITAKTKKILQLKLTENR